jgi:hypothetical protein
VSSAAAIIITLTFPGGGMYAWSTGSFDNEHATDFANDLVESEDLQSVLLALQAVIENAETEDLDATDCAVAVAAAEVVAAVAGSPGSGLSKPLKAYVDSLGNGVSASVRKLAQDAVGFVKRRSSLRTHWKGAGMLSEWLDDIEALESRLQS